MKRAFNSAARFFIVPAPLACRFFYNRFIAESSNDLGDQKCHAWDRPRGGAVGSGLAWALGVGDWALFSRPPSDRGRATAEATGTSAIRRSQRRVSTPRAQRPRRRSAARSALSRGPQPLAPPSRTIRPIPPPIRRR